jgi:hypothetical protein
VANTTLRRLPVELKEHAQPTEPSLVIQEIRARMEKLDLVDEIVGAVNSMRKAVGCLQQHPPRSR